jgi:hypothetical protein
LDAVNFLKTKFTGEYFHRVFSLFHWNVKKCVFNMLGLGWFRMKTFSEFCNGCTACQFRLFIANANGTFFGMSEGLSTPCLFKFSESILMPLHRGAPRAPKVRWALRWLERKRLMAEILRGSDGEAGRAKHIVTHILRRFTVKPILFAIPRTNKFGLEN